MIISAIILTTLTAVLTALLGFHHESPISRFELKRRAEHSREYRNQLHFRTIYPGLRALTHLLSLVAAVALCSVAYAEWQFVGALIAFGALILAILLGRTLRRVLGELIDKNVAWFNKYFSWAEVLGRISIDAVEPQIHSRQELLHVLAGADFIDEADKNLLVGAAKMPEAKLTDVMTRRSAIVSVNDGEVIGPKLIDELHSSGHRIFPVVSDDLDHIVGTLYLDDVVVVAGPKRTLADTMRPSPPVVARNQSLLSVLGCLVKQNTTIATVTDDKGATVGLVTLSDIVTVLSGQKK